MPVPTQDEEQQKPQTGGGSDYRPGTDHERALGAGSKNQSLASPPVAPSLAMPTKIAITKKRWRGTVPVSRDAKRSVWRRSMNGRQVPNSNGFVVTAANQAFAVGSKSDRSDGPGAPDQRGPDPA